MIPLSDPDDPRAAPFHALRTRARPPERFFVESELAVGRLLESGLPVEAVLATPPRAERLAPRVPAGCALYVTPLPLLREIVGFDMHRGCVACAPRPPLDGGVHAPLFRPAEATPPAGGAPAGGAPQDAAPADAVPADGAPFRVLVGAGLSDPLNAGALVRTARAFGVDLVLFLRAGADPLDPRAVRASMGSVFLQPLRLVDDLERDLARLRSKLGVRVLAATLGPGAQAIARFEPPRRWALLLGNEGRGLAPELIALADEEVTIPVAPEADSLNVAAAGAVLLHALISTD